MAKVTESDRHPGGETMRDTRLTLVRGKEPRGLLQQLADLETVMADTQTMLAACQAAIESGGGDGELAASLADMATRIGKAAMLRNLWEVYVRFEDDFQPRPRHLQIVSGDAS